MPVKTRSMIAKENVLRESRIKTLRGLSAKYSAFCLKNLGFSVEELREVGFTDKEIFAERWDMYRPKLGSANGPNQITNGPFYLVTMRDLEILDLREYDDNDEEAIYYAQQLRMPDRKSFMAEMKKYLRLGTI
jgi:hypothetical protein